MGAGYVKSPLYRESLDYLVVAFCRDYRARWSAIFANECSRRTRMEYEYINHRLYNAAAEIVGREAEIYIEEIGSYVGYAHSRIDGVSEVTYKTRKKEVKLNIAKKLHLID